MKKKLLIATVLCMLVMCLFVISVNAECTEHTYKWTVDLGSNGLLGEINAKGVCECGTTAIEKIPSVFVAIGYSSSDDGVVQSYAVNREALAKYEEMTGEKVKFGAVIATRNVIGNANPLNSKGEPVNEKVQVADFTDTKYDIIDVAVRGIPSELQGSADIIFAMYVNAGGRITYLDNFVEKTFCGARSYDEVVAKPKAEEPALDNITFIEGKRYKQLDLGFTLGYFWNGSTFQTSTDTNFREKYWGTNDSFTKETLPNGSIIFVDSANGWQYRPHKWSGSRPGNTKEKMVVVDDAWWGDYSKVGFNISLYKEKTVPSDENKDYISLASYTEEQIAEIFKIYVPIATVSDDNTGSDDDETTTPEEKPDYSAEKQNWRDDNTLKILAIGNSFSVDSMEYIYQAAKSAGIENIVLGNLYIGGCSLDTHLSNAKNNSGSYTYYTNSNGSWSSKGGVSIKTAVESDDWDFISMQQVSGYSGVESSYAALNELIDIVEPLNPSARLVWHMTWAYQTGSGHSDFGKYDKNQQTMYNAIISAVQNKILTNDRIEIVIPAGTSIQNARTSYVGDTLTRDGYHLSYDLGRFIGSLTFVKSLTGVSIDNVTYAPNGVDENQLKVAIESVNNACKTPFSVTKSEYEKAPQPEIDEELVELPLEYLGLIKSAYYNSKDNGKVLQSYENSNASNLPNFFATKMFTKDTLPVGSVIYIASDWQYRPERWPGSRPDNTTTERVIVDSTWWDEETERAFNISKISGANISSYTFEQIGEIFKIYVPKSALELNKPSVIPAGYRQLTLEELGLTQYAYYNSSDNHFNMIVTNSSHVTGKKFYATTTFTKDTLPVGSIIIIDSTWNYRPERWTKIGNRPDPVNTLQVYVDDAWWSTYTKRAFNISLDSGGSMANYSAEDIYSIFKIYVPDDTMEMNQLSAEDLGLTKCGYWNSTKEQYHEVITNAGDSANYFATKLFTKEELPVGSVIIIEDGWQYRPEGWIEGAQNSSRPNESTGKYKFLITEAWWGSFTERAFNIGKEGGGSLASYTEEQIAEIFKIYLPIEEEVAQ